MHNNPYIENCPSLFVKELLNLGDGELYSMEKIHWWLLKYENIYQSMNEEEQSKYITTLNDGSIARLPPPGKPPEVQTFTCIYEALDILSNFHRNEKYFQQEMMRYRKISTSDFSSQINWLSKNEKLGSEGYACFLLDYLDYSDTPEHLNVFFLHSKNLEFYVHKTDFKYTLRFLDVFRDLYWEKDLLKRFS